MFDCSSKLENKTNKHAVRSRILNFKNNDIFFYVDGSVVFHVFCFLVVASPGSPAFFMALLFPATQKDVGQETSEETNGLDQNQDVGTKNEEADRFEK